MNTLLTEKDIHETFIKFSYHFKIRQKERNISNEDVFNSLRKITLDSYLDNALKQEEFIIVNPSLNHCLVVCFSLNQDNKKSFVLITCLNKIPITNNGFLKFNNYSEIIYV